MTGLSDNLSAVLQRDATARQAGAPTESVSRAAAALKVAVIEDLRQHPASAAFVEKIPIGFARRHGMIGLASSNGHLPVAVADVTALEALDVVARYLGKPVTPVLAGAEQIAAAINAAYQQRSGQAQSFIEKLDERELPEGLRALANRDPASGLGASREDLLDIASRAPVIKLVNLMLFEAVKQGASDVHVQPYEERLVVRMRIDGVLFDAFELPRAMQEEVVSRVKVMGKMNIAEKRLPQDGRATVQVGDRVIDLRIASLPTSYGERVVIRLLDKSARLYTLNELGMDAQSLAKFRQLIRVEHGLILVTGPTGSGKSTTLYAALQEINSKQLNILTLEDPIEYQLPGVSQTQVSAKKGMTFAGGLRSVLRQDPDIIMVGEIRDHETAVMAIQSALTGHLVFSTLHTNDAASAMTRLLDLGIEPYLAASSVIGVLAQRLVRRVCPACAEDVAADREAWRQLGIEIETLNGCTLKQGRGCDACRRTGYQGRVGLFELLVVNDAIRRCIQQRATAAQIKSTGVEAGMNTLRDDGVAKALLGRTTVDEVVRVTLRATV